MDKRFSALISSCYALSKELQKIGRKKKKKKEKKKNLTSGKRITAKNAYLPFHSWPEPYHP